MSELNKLMIDQGNKTLNTDNELIRERIEEDMDFKIPGLPHSTVKQLQSASVRELIQKIENHPNRHALQRDLQQSQSFNPFSQESKQMIHDEVGNIELCELLDTEPKTQCKVCLSDIGIVYCTCRHFLQKGTEEKFIQYTMDLLSIPDYYTKKGRPHGHRYGKKPRDNEYYIANQLKKKCKKKNFQGIHDRFVRDEQFRGQLVEPKIFVAKWMILRTKIIPTILPHNETNDGHKVLLLHGGVGKVLGGLLIPMQVTMELSQALIEQGNLSYK